jgi:hypothetical protein
MIEAWLLLLSWPVKWLSTDKKRTSVCTSSVGQRKDVRLYVLRQCSLIFVTAQKTINISKKVYRFPSSAHEVTPCN